MWEEVTLALSDLLSSFFFLLCSLVFFLRMVLDAVPTPCMHIEMEKGFQLPNEYSNASQLSNPCQNAEVSKDGYGNLPQVLFIFQLLYSFCAHYALHLLCLSNAVCLPDGAMRGGDVAVLTARNQPRVILFHKPISHIFFCLQCEQVLHTKRMLSICSYPPPLHHLPLLLFCPVCLACFFFLSRRCTALHSTNPRIVT